MLLSLGGRAGERARGLALDGTMAVSVALVDLAGAWAEAHSPVQGDPSLKLPPVPHWAYLLVLGGGLALVGRRRAPLSAFALVVVFTTAYTALGYDDGAPVLAMAVGLYSVATRCSPRATWGAFAAGLAALLTAEVVFGPFGATQGPVTVVPFELVAGMGAGLAVANRRARLAEVRERAEMAQRNREEEARRQVDAERLRIARELHDVVAHSMATINVQAGVAVHLLREGRDDPGQAMAAMEAVRSTSKEALRELRGILNLLRSTDEAEPRAPAPRLAQLGDLVDVARNAGLPTRLVVEGVPRELSPAVDLAAYRIVQESLTNALRHAGPAHAVARCEYGPSALVVEVSDDGRGPPAGTAAPGGNWAVPGNGLVGMRERAQALGGALDAGPGETGGFVVRAVLPYVAGVARDGAPPVAAQGA